MSHPSLPRPYTAFNRVVGNIDSCHVHVKPPAQDANCYLNQKLFYSVQLQAVDHTATFIDVCVGYTGSVQDSRVLKNLTLTPNPIPGETVPSTRVVPHW